MAPRIPQSFLYIITLVIVGLAIYALPLAGKFLRSVHVRIATFLSNMYHAQELGTQYQTLLNERVGVYHDDSAIAKLERENDFLRKQLGLYKRESHHSLMLASIIGQGSGFGRQTLIIDKGINDGLKGEELVIVSPDVLIGTVRNIFSRIAIVSLVTNKDFTVKAETLTGVRGVIKGSVGGRVLFDEVSQAAALSQDDIIVTTNEKPSSPANIMIGKIQKIISQPTDTVKKAEVQVFFNPNLLEEAFILKAP